MSEQIQVVRELRWRIKQLNKQVGSQGETIHRLRAELAEVRELNSKVERGEIRRLERVIENYGATVERQKEINAELREKLSVATYVSLYES